MSIDVVQSYASAFYAVANETGKTNRFVEEIDAVYPIFKEQEIISFFKSPVFSAADKETVVSKSFEGKIDADLLDFIKLLARNGRIGFLSQIVEEFKDACTGGKSLKRGEVTSAAALTDAEKKSLQSAIEKKLNTKVSLDFKVSPELMGGIEAKVGSYIIEDSFRSNLQDLNDSLKRSSN